MPDQKKKRLFHFLALCFSLLFFLALVGLVELFSRQILLIWPNARLKIITDSNETKPVDTSIFDNKFRLPNSAKKREIYNYQSIQYLISDIDLSKMYPPETNINGILLPKPNQIFESTAQVKQTGQVLYKIIMKFDQFGRRVTPDSPHKSNNPNHLIFMGCSFVLGEGVDENETIPYLTAAQADNYKGYNLGRSGASPAESLALITRANFFSDIPEKNGLLVYILIDDHLRRHVGNLRNLANWVKDRPVAERLSNGTWVAEKTWKQAYPFRVKVSEWVKKSSFFKLMNFSWPSIKEQDYENLANILGEIKKEYLTKFGSENKFIVMFFFEDAHQIVRIIPYLERLGISYLDYSNSELRKIVSADPYIFYHPSAAANKFISEILTEDLLLK